MHIFLILALSVHFFANAMRHTEKRIYGGTEADIEEFPYQASLRISGLHHCGGSIIDYKNVLTAAHCVHNKSLSSLTVNVGTNHVSDGGISYTVRLYIFHKDYHPFYLNNDIALVRTELAMVFSPTVQPISINTKNIPENLDCILTGWGITKEADTLPLYLQKIHLKTFNLQKCKWLHKSWAAQLILSTNICTYSKPGEGACFSDSGSPLVHNGDQIGIVSWGKPCGKNFPDVFTKTSSYIDWIETYRLYEC